jgi:hypothetical protein
MKFLRIAWLLAFSFLFPNPWAWADNGSASVKNGLDGQGLMLSLDLRFEETSKDSSEQRFLARIDGKRMVLSKEYNGFKVPGNERVERTILPELEARIWAYIQNQGLDRRIDEIRRTDGIGLAGYLRLDIQGPGTVSIHIEGRTNIWGSDEYVAKTWGPSFVRSRTNLDHIRYFPKAQALFQFLWELK